METLVLTHSFLGGCLKFYFPSFHFFLTDPDTLCRSLEEIHRANLTVTPLDYISVQLLRTQKKTHEAKAKAQSSRKRNCAAGGGRGSPSWGGRLKPERMFWTGCTGVIFAADDK